LSVHNVKDQVDGRTKYRHQVNIVFYWICG